MSGKPLLPIVIILLALAGCGESALLAPAAPPPVPGSSPLGLPSAGTVCTHRWASAVDGKWHDAAAWNTGTVPDSTSVVCLNRAGSYTVSITAGNPASAAQVYVGDGSSAIALDVAEVLFTDELLIAPQAAVRCAAYVLVEGTLTNDGRVRLDDCDLEAIDVVNRGEIRVVAGVGTPSLLAPTIRMEAGRIGGDRWLAVWSSSFIWSGGTLDSIQGTSEPVVGLLGSHLELPSRAVVGGVRLLGDGSVEGVVGSQARLYLDPDSVRLGGIGGGPLINEGWIELTTLTDDVLTGQLVNLGTVVALESWTGEVRLRLDSLVNRGTLHLDDATRFDAAGGTLVNSGVITSANGAELFVTSGEFIAEPSGTMSGALVLEGSRLAGSGFLDQVRSTAGVVSPGQSGSSMGTLDLQSLELDGGSRVVVDLGPGAGGVGAWADLLRVAGAVVLDGTIEARVVAPLLPGVCGQVERFLTWGGSRSGGFASAVGFQLAATRAWRLFDSTGVMKLAGFDPTRRLSRAPNAVLLAEGGPGAAVDLCLGGPAPTADVSIAMSGRQGQVSVTPGNLTFSPAYWTGPQRVTVTAIDDPVAEPDHSDRVAFRLTSADPGYDRVAVADLPVTLTDNDPAPDLTLTLVGVAPASIAAGQRLEATFRLTNLGPAASSGSTVTLVPLAGLTWVRSTGIGCTLATGAVTCSAGALAAGGSLDFILVFDAGVAGVYGNTLTVIGAELDPVAANNTLLWSLTVN